MVKDRTIINIPDKLKNSIVTTIIILIFTISLIPYTAIEAEGSHQVNDELKFHSPHNYPNNYYKNFVIHRPGASQIKIVFGTIETEINYDFIYVKDKQGNVYNTYSGSYENEISDWVSGSYVFILFISDQSYTDWGFNVREIVVEYFWNYQSPHNYENDYDNSWWVRNKYGSTSMRIQFETIDVEDGYDYIKIYDSKGTLKWTKTGQHTDVFSPWIDGPWIRIRLVSDYSYTGYGFKVSWIFTDSSDEDNKFEVSVFGVGNYLSQDSLDNTDAYVAANWLTRHGWTVIQNLRNAAVDSDDFYDDGDHGDLIYFTGHGSDKGRACLDAYNDWLHYAQKDRYFDHNAAENGQLGADDCEWVIFAACDILDHTKSHLYEFIENDVHAVYGYRHQAFDLIDQEILQDFLKYCSWGWKLRMAWAVANANHNQGGATVLQWRDNGDDHLWGFGFVGEDPIVHEDVWDLVKYR